MWLAQRVQRVRPSGVRKIFDLARKAKDPVNMSLGEPDFDVPVPIKEEAVEWTRKGFNKYPPSGGIPELREKLSAYLKARDIFCEDVVITPGVTGGILLALMVTLDPGDEVLIPDPSFVMYEYQTSLLGGTPVFFDTYPDFTLREELLRRAITKKTKIIIINSPNNPTGAVCSRRSWRWLHGSRGKRISSSFRTIFTSVSFMKGKARHPVSASCVRTSSPSEGSRRPGA